MSDERLTVTVEEAARVLGISRAFAYVLVKNEELPSVRLGRRVVVPRRALERLLEPADPPTHVDR
jgi:excisionase family DNA binding protein